MFVATRSKSYQIVSGSYSAAAVRTRTAFSAPSPLQPQAFGELHFGIGLAIEFEGLNKFQAEHWVAPPLDYSRMRFGVGKIDEYAVGWDSLIKSLGLIRSETDLRPRFGYILCRANPGHGSGAISDYSAEKCPFTL